MNCRTVLQFIRFAPVLAHRQNRGIRSALTKIARKKFLGNSRVAPVNRQLRVGGVMFPC